MIEYTHIIKKYDEEGDPYFDFGVDLDEKGFDVERFIFSLSFTQSKVLLLRSLGYKTSEIAKIIGMPSKWSVYQIDNQLHKIFKKYNKS